MMPEAHQQAMYWLFGAVALLMAFIFGTLILSALKKQKPEPVVPAKDLEPSSNSQDLVRAQVPVQLASALSKTEEQIFGRIAKIFKSSGDNSGHLDDIEEILYTSDLGPKTVQKLMERLNEDLSKSEKRDLEKVKTSLKSCMMEFMQHSERSGERVSFVENGLTVLMVVGVNGAGKTTSIGKLAAQFASEGKKVLVAAGDTFRAAAQNQLKTWTERAKVEIFSPEGVSDPGAVAFDAVSKAKAQGFDLVIIDTAGRLHTQANLMEELKKVQRVMKKVIPEAPHECFIVLDANMGQNALIQAKEFHQALGLTGAVLTKMDGTAKGGVAVGLVAELGLAVRYIGVGEGISDLRLFDKKEFVDSIFAEPQS